jgi:hypothetical protein
LVFAKVILLFWGGLFVLVLSQLSTKFGTRFGGVFGTHLEQAWNIVGTIYIDFEIVTRMRGTGVELAWNLGGIWGWIWGGVGDKKKHHRGMVVLG